MTHVIMKMTKKTSLVLLYLKYVNNFANCVKIEKKTNIVFKTEKCHISKFTVKDTYPMQNVKFHSKNSTYNSLYSIKVLNISSWNLLLNYAKKIF